MCGGTVVFQQIAKSFSNINSRDMLFRSSHYQLDSDNANPLFMRRACEDFEYCTARFYFVWFGEKRVRPSLADACNVYPRRHAGGWVLLSTGTYAVSLESS